MRKKWRSINKKDIARIRKIYTYEKEKKKSKRKYQTVNIQIMFN